MLVGAPSSPSDKNDAGATLMVMVCAFDQESLESVPNRPAVFVLFPSGGEPYLARTNVLKRRLGRLSRTGNLCETVEKVEYWLTGSVLEAQARMYELARVYFPERYARILKLRMPSYLKVGLANPFPRTQVTSHIGKSNAQYFGPFRSRAAAERFEGRALELFQVRRCQEDLAPAPDHPGCMYGEMAMCLRPCQQLVSADEYRSEVRRVEAFLTSGGKSLLTPAIQARESASCEMDFEEAARQHRRIERIEDVLKLRDDLAFDLESLNAVAVMPSAEANAVALGVMREGHWQGIQMLVLDQISLDQKLREIIGSFGAEKRPPKERQEYLAILSRWFYSSWRDGELLMFDSFEQLPYRKLVKAVSRVHRSVV